MELETLAIVIASVEALAIAFFIYQVNIVYKEQKFYYKPIRRWKKKSN